MPDQDRKSSFLSQCSADGVRCPICPGFVGATFQADCVCCGRQVPAATTQPDSKAEDLTKSVKALSIKTEVDSQVNSSSSKAVNPACSRTSNGWQRRSNIPVLRSYSRLGAGEGGSQGLQQLAGGCCRSAGFRVSYQHPRHVARPLPSRRGSTRGSACRGAGRAANGGAHPGFKGVRTRQGIKGYLVEIRPPKWKKTIWLGTYRSSVEAAGAYDAGVFYTKKSNTKYNFFSSEGTFPPLPPHLHLDRADNMEEIKLFVQNQARVAARRMGNIAMDTTTTTRPSSSHRDDQDQSATDQLGVDASHSNDANSLVHEPTSSGSCITSVDESPTSAPCMNSSSEPLVEIESQFQIPMDLDYLGQCFQAEISAEEIAKNMFLDYTNYFDQQGAAPEKPFSEDEEDEEFTMTSSD